MGFWGFVIVWIAWYFCHKPTGKKVIKSLFAGRQASYYTGIRLLERCDDRPTSILRGMPFWKIASILWVSASVPTYCAWLIIQASFDGNNPITKIMLMFGAGAFVYFVAGTAWTLDAIYSSPWMIVQRGVNRR